MAETDQDLMEIYYSRPRILLNLVLLSASLGYISYELFYQIIEWNNTYIFLLLVAASFGVDLLWDFLQARSPALVLTEKGLSYPSQISGVIPWREIEGAEARITARSGKKVYIRLRSEGGLGWRRVGWFGWLLRKFGFRGDIVVDLWKFNVDDERFMAFIGSRCRRATATEE